MRLHHHPAVQALLFIVATLGATAILVAAGLNETAVDCAQPCVRQATK